MDYEESKKYFQDFCKKYDIELSEKGEIGFGRPCVGILKNNSYIEYNACWYDKNYNNNYYFGYNELFDEVKPESAYHKHECFAVLCCDDEQSYKYALIELAEWIKLIEIENKIIIKPYQTMDMNDAKTFLTGDRTYFTMVLEDKK